MTAPALSRSGRTDWRKPCEHGKYEPHNVPNPGTWGNYCSGGYPVTIADLIAELVRRGEWPHGIPAVPVGEGK